MSFASLILDGFYLRIILIFIGVFISLRIIGIKNIYFLKEYINRGFFSINKIIYLVVSVLSIFYFNYLISTVNSLSISSAFTENYWLSLLILLLLIGVIMYAFLYMLGSITEAKEAKKEIENAQFGKNMADILGVASFFVPGGVIAKGLAFGGVRLFHLYVDGRVKTTLSEKVKGSINDMLKVVSVNLFIVLGSTYLITGQIIFW